MANVNKLFMGFDRIEFERKLKGIQYMLDLNDFIDVTESLSVNGKVMLERIYECDMGNQFIRIYSTVDIRTDCTREVGNDKVKILSVIKNNDGSEKYHLLGKHLRINSLFDNMKKSLSSYYENRCESYHSDDLIQVLI